VFHDVISLRKLLTFSLSPQEGMQEYLLPDRFRKGFGLVPCALLFPRVTPAVLLDGTSDSLIHH
jgi:hypothetical protein